MARVDTHEIQPEEYEEIPELTEESLAMAVIKKPVTPASTVPAISPPPVHEDKIDEHL